MLEGLVHLRALDVPAEVGDDQMRHLSGLVNLEYLDLSFTALTDRGLAHLAGLTRLKNLNLLQTRFSDAGLENLRGMTMLEELR